MMGPREETTGGRRRGGVILLAMLAVGASWAAGVFSDDHAIPDAEEVRADPLHQEARREVEAAIELAGRFGTSGDLAEIRDLKPAAHRFEEFAVECGYRIRGGARERVIVVGSGIIHERALGGGAVFRHIDNWVGCPSIPD